MAVKKFVAFDFLTAADVNDYLMEQSVMVLPGTASIGSAGTAIGTATSATIAPAEGMLVYLADLNQYQMNLDGSATGWYPVAGQMPYIELTKTSSQNFTTATVTLVTWATPTINRGGFTVSSNVVTVPYTGLYNVNASVYWAASSAGSRLTKIMKNGADYTRDAIAPSALASTVPSAVQMYLTAGDTISVEAYQSSGGTLAAQADLTRLEIRYVCP